MRRLALAVLSCLAASTLNATPNIITGLGPDVASITPIRDAFRTVIGGGTTAGANGSFGGVRREINWDGVPDAVSAPSNLPLNFFNVNSPRGVVFSTPGTGVQVSNSPATGGFEFENINPNYPFVFQSFSPVKLFTPIGANVTDVNFFVPGTTTPATVSAFGAMFSDVDNGGTTSITYYDLAGTSLGTFFAPPFPGGFSFLGVQFTTERVARVRIVTGNTIPGPNEGPGIDVVVMDDFIYSEPIAPAVSIDDVSATEGAAVVFTVSLNYAVPTATTVMYGTADSTALTSDGDYTAIAAGTSATIPAGSTSTTVSVTTSADTKFEPDETFFVNITSAGTATIADAQGVGTIVNDDAAPTMAINDVTLAEGNSGTTNFVFTVALSNPSSTVVSATWSTADGTALSPQDYASSSGTVTFTPGLTSTTLTVPVAGDLTTEANETFLVNLSAPSGATIADAQGQGTITNDDATPTMSINDVTLAEGNSGTTNFVFTVTLANPSSTVVSAAWATADGTALSPQDYTSSTGNVTFNAGVTTQSITVPVVGDVAFEGDETFFVNLTAPSGATIADAQGQGTITNDEPSTAVPTLSEWAMVLLAMALVAFGALKLR
jgi:hypothetical protein